MANNTYEKIVTTGLAETTLDLGIDYTEIALDSFLDNDAVRELPVVKTIVGLIKGGLAIKDTFFSKKFITFLKKYHQSNLSETERNQFLHKYQHDSKYRTSVVELLIIMNDRFLHITQSEILGNLFSAHVKGIVSWEQFQIMTSCVDKLEISAIPLLYELEKEKEPFHKGYSPMGDINATFLISAGIAQQWGTHLIITPIGIYLFIYGIKADHECNIMEVIKKAGYSIS